jgi:hypothetical protein
MNSRPFMRSIARTLVALIALLGLLWHVATARGEFGRGFDGFQGAFFASAATNYERMGLAPSFGFPVVHVDPGDDRLQWNVYTNHPRLVPQLAWWSLANFAPTGWDQRPGPVPLGTEAALRAPFLLAQFLGWALFACAVWIVAGRRAALATFVLLVFVPLALPYAGLVNYEHPSLVFVAAASVALAIAWRRPERARMACAVAGALCGAGALVTYTPILFLPALLVAAPRGRWWVLVAGVPSAALALVPHVLATARWNEASGAATPSLVARAVELWQPLFDGTLPPTRWLAVQWSSSVSAFGGALLFVSALGAALALANLLTRRRISRDTTIDGDGALQRLALGLALGALTVQVLYWRHTGDPQENFLLNAAPAVVFLAVVTVRACERRLAQRAPFAGTLIVVVLAASGAHAGRQLLASDRAPGPLDLAGARGPSAPLPRTAGEEVAALLPPDAVGWYPHSFGWTPAVAYHAWRPLLPIAAGRYGDTTAAARALGLGERTVWLVLPLVPADEAQRAEVERLVADLTARLGREPTWSSGTFLRAASTLP